MNSKVKEENNMRKISVEVEQLEACASRMDEKNLAYLKNCEALFEAIETMRLAWKGEDNTAFTSRIISYESDFKQLHTLASEYTDFLRHTARSYRSMQQELITMANSL